MIESLNQNMDTISYIIAIVILLSPFILKQKFGKGHIAGLTITIGIFGTFFGVFIGLLNFNPEEITASIPKLINGLQTAFVTSIAGLLANLVLRIMPSIYGFKEEVIGKKAILKMMDMQAGDVKETAADTSELNRWVNFKPNTSIKEGVKQFVDWYKNYY